MQHDYNPSDLAYHRLQQARECLKSAELEIAAKIYRTAANRSYYCIFHAMRALLAFDRFDSKKHSGIIAAFRQRYIRTKIFPSNYSDIVGKAFDVRIDSDYQDYYLISKEKVTTQLENAKTFLAAVEGYLAPKIEDTQGEA